MPVTPATITAKSKQAHVPAAPLGTLTAAPATTSSTSTTPFGFTQTQADRILALVIEMRDLLIKAGLAS